MNKFPLLHYFHTLPEGQTQILVLLYIFTSLFELTQFSGDSWRPSTVGSLISGTIVNDAGSMHANLKKKKNKDWKLPFIINLLQEWQSETNRERSLTHWHLWIFDKNAFFWTFWTFRHFWHGHQLNELQSSQKGICKVTTCLSFY